MPYPLVADRILNKELRTADKVQFYSLGIALGPNNS